MLAGDWAHKHRVQQYSKTDYLYAVAYSRPQLQERLITAGSSSYSLTLKTTQAFITTHDATLSRHAVHAHAQRLTC